MYSPTLDEFLKLAAQGNLIPVTRRLLADIETPLSAYRKIRGPGESFLFESVEGGEHLGRYSFVGCNPRAVIRQVGGPGGGDRERQGGRDASGFRPGARRTGGLRRPPSEPGARRRWQARAKRRA